MRGEYQQDKKAEDRNNIVDLIFFHERGAYSGDKTVEIVLVRPDLHQFEVPQEYQLGVNHRIRQHSDAVKYKRGLQIPFRHSKRVSHCFFGIFLDLEEVEDDV